MQIGHKIRQIRTLKGLSQDNVASELGISQKAYSLIENNDTQLTPERKKKIAAIFGITEEDIDHFDTDKIINQTNNDHSIGYVVENLQQTNLELIEALKKQYESHLDDLRKENSFLKSIIEKQNI
ncbi:MAG: helix-turn-helix transcriptional regulator [Chitinophagales bacterium]|nr:helix-turn-helix transcriptional regulator [Chitinophagales bacterium]